MAETSITNPDHLSWELAEGMVQEFLPKSVFAEDVISIERGEPGVLIVRPPDGRRLYEYARCELKVRRRRDRRDFDRLYSFEFEWREGRWQLVSLPRVGFYEPSATHR